MEENIALTNSEVLSVYDWVDQFELAKPKKKFARDFSDGTMLCDILS